MALERLLPFCFLLAAPTGVQGSGDLQDPAGFYSILKQGARLLCMFLYYIISSHKSIINLHLNKDILLFASFPIACYYCIREIGN